MRDSCNAIYYANDAYASAEDMRLRYPRRAYNRSLQFADYMKDAADDWPACVSTSFWFGCVFHWLDHPMECEDDTFLDAKEELRRLHEERRA